MVSDLILLGRYTLQKEAEALSHFVNTLDKSFSETCEKIFSCTGTVLLTGMGKSGLVARKWASTFLSTGTKSYFINPAEASHGDLGIMRSGDLLIALSYSGETTELSYVLRHAKENQVPIIAITGNPVSSLAKQSNLLLSVYLSEEACPLKLAPTTSTTLMMALGDAVASTLMQMRGFTEEDFAKLHPGGSLGRRLWLKVSDVMHQGEAIPKVSINDSLEKTLLEMTHKRLGMTVVIDDTGTMKGIITDGDIRRFFQKRDINSICTAKDLMTPSPRTLLPNVLAVEAREVMEKNRIHHLVIQDETKKLVGVIHLDDLFKHKVI